MTILRSFKRGAWESHIVQTDTGLRVRLDHPNGFNTDWPIHYGGDTYGYDMWNPPRDARRATRAAFKVLESEK